MTRLGSPYVMRCTVCRDHVHRGSLGSVGGIARAHEQQTGHRVQVTTAGPVVAPLPRFMWADATLRRTCPTCGAYLTEDEAQLCQPCRMDGAA